MKHRDWLAFGIENLKVQPMESQKLEVKQWIPWAVREGYWKKKVLSIPRSASAQVLHL